MASVYNSVSSNKGALKCTPVNIKWFVQTFNYILTLPLSNLLSAFINVLMYINRHIHTGRIAGRGPRKEQDLDGICWIALVVSTQTWGIYRKTRSFTASSHSPKPSGSILIFYLGAYIRPLSNTTRKRWMRFSFICMVGSTWGLIPTPDWDGEQREKIYVYIKWGEDGSRDDWIWNRNKGNHFSRLQSLFIQALISYKKKRFSTSIKNKPPLKSHLPYMVYRAQRWKMLRL